MRSMPSIHDLPTPALLFDADALDHNVRTMAAVRPGASLRPHVKAHKCTSLAAAQMAIGHRTFTCATPREVLGMVRAGVGDDLLLANEVLDPTRLAELAAAQGSASITVAVDSVETVDAAARAGLRRVLVDVDVGLPRCGCPPEEAGRLADLARARGLEVRGVMGYEGHLMMVLEPAEQRRRVDAAMDLLLAAHADVGGDIVSAGGTGTHLLHDRVTALGRVTEVQAGSYALMDTHYARHGFPFRQAAFVLGTVISVRRGRQGAAAHAVADVGLKALGMDHGDPSIDGARVWFCSDEHVTFSADPDASVAEAPDASGCAVGDRVRVVPAHIDPTVAQHEVAWVVRGDEVVDRWPIDLRGW